MPNHVDDALLHAMSDSELSRVRTELRLLLPEAYQQKSDRVREGPTLLCNHVKLASGLCPVTRVHRS